MDYTNKLRLVYGDSVLGIHGKDFSYLFSYPIGGLESMVIKGKEWVYRAPKPTFWRALTDNDRGNHLELRSGMWYGADMFIQCVSRKVWIDGVETITTAPVNNKAHGTECAKRVKMSYEYETLTVPVTKVEVSYEVDCEGVIYVDVHYRGKEGLPELPVFGMRFIMPTKAVYYEYEGLSGETYPDRMAGGIPGVYRIEGMPVTPYLVPQDCGVHMNTKWVKVYRNQTLSNVKQGEEVFGLCFEMRDKEFAFTCLPYTSQELQNATHQEELPPERRAVVTILGAVRGVGGMDSWGADTEPQYRISAEEDIHYSFKISGC